MADQWQSFTNKKLHFARLQIEAWEGAEKGDADSYREAFLFHAASAYKSLIAEVMASYGLAVEMLSDLATAVKQLEKVGRQSSELTQMKNMEVGNGWLSVLLSAYSLVSRPAYGQTDDKIESQALIAVVNPDNFKIESVEGARKVLACLKEQVAYIRNLNVEY
ncbi:MAG: DUF6586 family protein [Endozoicomonas sp.]